MEITNNWAESFVHTPYPNMLTIGFSTNFYGFAALELAHDWRDVMQHGHRGWEAQHAREDREGIIWLMP